MSQASESLLIPVEEFASMLNVSERTLWRLLSARKVPEPVRLGRLTRWSLDRVKEWIEHGCPEPGGK